MTPARAVGRTARAARTPHDHAPAPSRSATAAPLPLRLSATALASLLAVLNASCGGRAAGSDCEPYWDDVRQVQAPASTQNVSRARLAELWQAHGLELAAPAAVTASSDGHVAVVDYMLAEIFVISPRGEPSGQWSRRGRGPGELVMPVAATWNGDTLLVFDIEQSKVVRLVNGSMAAPDAGVPSEFVAPAVAAGEIGYVAVTAAGAVVLAYPPRPLDSAADSAEVVIARASGARRDTLALMQVPMTAAENRPLQQPGAARPVLGTGPDGWRAESAADGSYRILLRDATDAPVHQVCRPVDAEPLTTAERGETAPRGFEADADALTRSTPPQRLSTVGTMIVGPAGELWVGTRRMEPFTDDALYGPATPAFDVFTADGAFRGVLDVPEGVRIRAIAGDRAWGLRIGPLDQPVLVAFRVEWDGQ
jgi:hypothetical protein